MKISDPRQLLKRLLQSHGGVALGEDHKSSPIYEFIGDLAPFLKEQGVRTIYVEAVLSKDAAAFSRDLRNGDDDAVGKYLQSRSWNPDLAEDYARMVKAMNAQGIEVVGIDIKTGEQPFKESKTAFKYSIDFTNLGEKLGAVNFKENKYDGDEKKSRHRNEENSGDQRFKEANPHWAFMIDLHQAINPGKYIVVGGNSHFGHAFGPGVNVELGIPSIDFEVARTAAAVAACDVSTKLHQGRKVADYTITLREKPPATEISKTFNKTREREYSREEIEGWLDQLRRVGEVKLMGYLPLDTLTDICHEDPQALKASAEKKGLRAEIWESHEIDVFSGALYIYDPGKLEEFLQLRPNKSIVERNNWPLDADGFVQKVATEFAEDKLLYALVALAFNDRRYRSWQPGPGEPVKLPLPGMREASPRPHKDKMEF